MEGAKTYFRTGFGLKRDVLPVLEREYHSEVVDRLKAAGFQATAGDITVRLAAEFGYCYGVDRAVQYAYEAAHKFTDRRLFLVGEIIHNPHVNKRLREMGITFLMPGADGAFDFSGVTPEDVVIIPAFGVARDDFAALQEIGCLLVDTTCGSVLNVWKRVESYASDGYTAIIHGKYYHEETKATASQVLGFDSGSYLIVRDLDEADLVCDYIVAGRDPASFLEQFGHTCSPGFDPDRDLRKIGVANQTTMLASETAAIAERFQRAMIERYGADQIDEHYRRFDTLCSATQDRQDAIDQLKESMKEQFNPEADPDLEGEIKGYFKNYRPHGQYVQYQGENGASLQPVALTGGHTH